MSKKRIFQLKKFVNRKPFIVFGTTKFLNRLGPVRSLLNKIIPISEEPKAIPILTDKGESLKEVSKEFIRARKNSKCKEFGPYIFFGFYVFFFLPRLLFFSTSFNMAHGDLYTPRKWYVLFRRLSIRNKE